MTVLAAALAVSLAACGGPAPAPPPKPAQPAPVVEARPDPVLFIPGERIEWAVSWLDVTAATFTLTVSELDSAGGRRIVEVATLAESTGLLARVGANLRGRAQTTIDLHAGLPLAVAGTFDDVYSGAVLDGQGRDIKTPMPWDAELARDEVAHDTHSGLGRLRAFRGEPKQSLRYYGRIRGSVWSVDVVAGEVESIEIPMGTRSARRLSCRMSPVDDELRPAHWDEPYPFDVWISDDDDRVPIQIRVDSRLGGVVVFQAVSYSRP